METQTTQSATPQLPVLYDLPLVKSRFGLPAQYQDARDAFAEGEKAFAARDFGKAASDFMDAATLLAVKKTTTYSADFALMRRAAYQNAFLCYRQALQNREGRAAFAAARTRDPANQDVLDGLIKKLN